FHAADWNSELSYRRAVHDLGVPALSGRGTKHRLEISLRVGDVIRKTGFATLPGAGHPDRTGRGRGGAADAVGLFAKHHIKTLERAHQGCRHAGCPSADNKRVDLDRGSTQRRAWCGDRHFPSDSVTAHAGIGKRPCDRFEYAIDTRSVARRTLDFHDIADVAEDRVAIDSVV